MEEEKYMQAKRLVFMLKEFQKGRKFTVREMMDEIARADMGGYKERTVQRDLQLLAELEPMLSKEREGRKYRYYIERQPLSMSAAPAGNQLLSLYMLKAQLRTFRGTFVESELDALLESLERRLPYDIFPSESLFWDKNIGNYDYSGHSNLISNIINAISKKHWVKISYERSGEGMLKTYQGQMCKLFTYAGYMYAATYLPDSGFIALSVHWIRDIERMNRPDIEVPEFDYREFTSIRFGVFWGKPVDIELTIDRKFNKYFVGRYWHPTQKFSEDSDGNLLLKMTVPLGPDLLSWIMGWGGAVIACRPDSLREKLITGHREAIDRLM